MDSKRITIPPRYASVKTQMEISGDRTPRVYPAYGGGFQIDRVGRGGHRLGAPLRAIGFVSHDRPGKLALFGATGHSTKLGLFVQPARLAAPTALPAPAPRRHARIGFVLSRSLACSIRHKSFSTKYLPVLPLRRNWLCFAQFARWGDRPQGASRRSPGPNPHSALRKRRLGQLPRRSGG